LIVFVIKDSIIGQYVKYFAAFFYIVSDILQVIVYKKRNPIEGFSTMDAFILW